MSKILIKNGKIWDGNNFYFADVLTEHKIISKIEPAIDLPADFIFDADGKIVSPGLIDCHVHLKGIAPGSFGIDPQMGSFPFGVTAVNDAGSIHGDRRLLDSFSVKNTVFVGVDIKNNHADFALTEALLQTYGDKAIGIKVYFDTNLTEVRDTTPLQEICDYARMHNLKVMVHCSNSPTPMAEIVHTLSCGDILTHIYHGGENSCCDNDFEALRIANQKHVILDAGFAGNTHTDFSRLKSAVEAGFIPDTISTDITLFSAYKRGGRYGMTMCMSIARTAGMREEDIFRMVTSNPAKALGKENEWGHLQVGRCADIAVLDYADEGFNLVNKSGHQIQNEKGYRCVFTVADGEVVYRD